MVWWGWLGWGILIGMFLVMVVYLVYQYVDEMDEDIGPPPITEPRRMKRRNH